MKKVFSVLLSLVMLMSLLSVGVAVSAATPDAQVIEATAGETIKIKFSEDNCYGVSGAIEYSNRNLFASLTPGGTTSYGKITENAFILSSADKVTCEVILTVKISANAKVGDTCVMSFTDCELVENNEDFTGRSGYTKTVTVKVVKKETPTEPSKTEPSKTTKPSSTTTKPSTANLDYTGLTEQIDIAQSLNKSNWTTESWVKLESALKAAVSVRNTATIQSQINASTAALAEAIADLVPVDHSALSDLIQEIEDWLEENDVDNVSVDLHTALTQAENALRSGDQNAIQEAHNDLLLAFLDTKKPTADTSKDTANATVTQATDNEEDDAVSATTTRRSRRTKQTQKADKKPMKQVEVFGAPLGNVLIVAGAALAILGLIAVVVYVLVRKE